MTPSHICVRRWSLALLIGAALTTSCTAPDRTSYGMTFHQTSADQYGVLPECSGGSNLYCKGSRPSDVTYQADLTISGDSVTMVVTGGGTWAGYITSGGNNSVTLSEVNSSSIPTCPRWTFTLGSQDPKVSGTWSRTFDCHGLSAAGDFVGSRLL